MCFSSDAAVDTLSCFSNSRFLEMIKKQIIKGIRKSKKKTNNNHGRFMLGIFDLQMIMYSSYVVIKTTSSAQI